MTRLQVGEASRSLHAMARATGPREASHFGTYSQSAPIGMAVQRVPLSSNLHAASAAGWGARGLDFPGHFLLSLDGARGTAVVDPFNGGVALPAQELRALLKRGAGAGAELRPGLLVPMSRRAVLLRMRRG